ncbi:MULTISPECIES: 50S ribosomal protein L1 [Methanosphaera]|jgi:large subunit ribosomal protein L1|uniref:Large ribosomal subunit protein uL1 n=2 Tax=Methanosphaera stadtmanae TaxID=2317 RepID=RL1_METST|nr:MULTISPECIES: 50S ribosomal protein L1 [Methanosphaera]Q2NEW1.1 RecName: Full=Large ribosomal subunit protein uL1; AltName: Full=50S ribosomal protein L1 [Methanosphaera stadtmanae DSM 3091]ABC57642.1 50S ribosomal protein L1P [Methanosphaera stadtmanae DSM 3091]MDO5821869.1 50S ribosomal protein L1 [Methanosphaera sp.]OEC92888.1 50S ribosomal protein L1 [Methanosphaera sp. A6]RAP02686.1 50S ribosomal protein L1 [Methanosphaera stadtmanae]RAP46517.1 MAG: 50S ribosomal protein L1 [Methanosp
MTQVIEEAVKKVLEESKPRNFTQSIDVVITINDLDINKPENRLDEEVLLPNGRGKDVKIAFIAEGELAYQAEQAGADLVINKEKLEELGKNRPEAKKLANSYDFFVAQTDLMPTVGRFLGPVLGPRKKMPKPIPASANPETILGRLRSTIKIRVKDQPIIQSIVGSEDMTEAQVAENIDAIMDVLDRNLEKGSKQIKAMYLKTTMGPVTRVI